MKPTIGRIVLYQVAGNEVLPAIVLRAHTIGETPFVDLEVFGMLPPEPNTPADEVDERIDARFAVNVTEGKPSEVGRWFWPIREAS